MPGYNKLKLLLVERGITQTQVAKAVGIPRQRFNLILNGQQNRDFRVGEVKRICEYLNINADDYFFDNKVSN